MSKFEPYLQNGIAHFPILSVQPNYSSIYYISDSKKSKLRNDNSLTNLHCNKTFGWLSDTSKKNIRKATNLLLYLSPYQIACMVKEKKQIKFRITFVTLTLPARQRHTDNEITQKCLHDFLNILRNDYNLIHYVWKAEKQKNGNIHYHLTTNIFIHYEELRKIWNDCIEKLGYVTDYRNNMIKFHNGGFRQSNNPEDKRSIKQQYEAYLFGLKTNWSSPNTTDVHSVRNIRNLAGYVAEYFTKNPLNEQETDIYLKNTQIIKQCTRAIKLIELDMKKRDDYFNNYIVSLNEIIENKKAERAQAEQIILQFKDKFIQGRVWFLSRSLSGFSAKIPIDLENYSEELEQFLQKFPNKLKNTDNCSVLLSSIDELKANGCLSIYNKFNELLKDFIELKTIHKVSTKKIKENY